MGYDPRNYPGHYGERIVMVVSREWTPSAWVMSLECGHETELNPAMDNSKTEYCSCFKCPKVKK